MQARMRRLAGSGRPPVNKDDSVASTAVPLELNPKLVGAISGVMTGAGNLGGVFGPISAGYLYRATASWALPFLVAASFAALAFLIFFFLVEPKPLGEAALSEPAVQKKAA